MFVGTLATPLKDLFKLGSDTLRLLPGFCNVSRPRLIQKNFVNYNFARFKPPTMYVFTRLNPLMFNETQT